MPEAYRTEFKYGRHLMMVGTIFEFFANNNGRLMVGIKFNHGRDLNAIFDLIYIWSAPQTTFYYA